MMGWGAVSGNAEAQCGHLNWEWFSDTLSLTGG